MNVSFNNRVITEVYKKESGPRQEVKNGWATPGQKNNLKGLKVLVDAMVGEISIPAGSTAYVKEETLHTAAWASKSLKSENLTESFMLLPTQEIEYIDVLPLEKDAPKRTPVTYTIE